MGNWSFIGQYKNWRGFELVNIHQKEMVYTLYFPTTCSSGNLFNIYEYKNFSFWIKWGIDHGLAYIKNWRGL